MSMRLHSLIAAVAFLSAAAAAPLAAQQDVADPAVTMKTGRDLFEKSCRLCHGLDRALALTRDAPAWGLVVKRMVAYGAPLNAEQRPLVLRYLATRSTFAGKCGGCHELTRVVGDKPGVRDWKTLAGRMAGHVREFEKQGKAPAGVAFSPEELTDIAALLQVVIPN
jgi:mono/diheme cytochrome c family protein